MKKITLLLSAVIALSINVKSQDIPTDNNGMWQVGIGFGEIPFLSKSFKPSLTAGYRFNDHLYVGAMFQLVDNLERNEHSFDAQNLGFDGLVSSKQKVGQRALLHARITPVKHGPFISVGFVYNGQDKETVVFDNRNRQIGSNYYEGDVTVIMTREKMPSFRPALGVGYEYTFKNNMGLNVEWTFNVFNKVPTPVLEVESDFEISEEDLTQFKANYTNQFTDNFHNRYHIFHIGGFYKF